jgi:hypothetical protein
MRFDEIKKGEKDANGYTRCWPGKHAEGTKKGKNGGQVRNCQPNESVNEMDKSQTPPGRDGGDPDAGKKQYTANATTPKKTANDAEKILNKEWTKSLSKDKLDALAGPRYKKKGVAEGTNDYFKRRKDEEDRIAGTKAPAKRTPKQTDYEKKRKQQSVTEGQEVDVSAVVGKLYDIIDNQENVIKNADYDQQVRQATIVRDRAVKALNMIKTNPSDVNAAWNYLQNGEQGVAEDYNAEYDDEAGMAHGSLHTLKNAVEGLQQVIDDRDNLPEWCQEKISLAEDYLVTVWDYLQSEKAQGIDPELTEEFDLIESSINQIADYNGVDPEMIWEDLESLSHDELYVFAVTSEPIMEDWQKANKSDRTDGMSRKAVKAYRRANPGSKLQTAVTTKPSKLKKGSKASKRRKSYCSRSRGQMKMHNISCAKTPDKAICKARRRWNC